MKARLTEKSTQHTTEWAVPLDAILDIFIDPEERTLGGCSWWITSGNEENVATIVRCQTVRVAYGPQGETVKERQERWDPVSKDEVKTLIAEALSAKTADK